MSDRFPLSIHSDPDVAITIYDGAETEVATTRAALGHVVAEAPRGLYRIRLERCGFLREEVIVHDAPQDQELRGPAVASPAPIAIALDSDVHGPAAHLLSQLGNESGAPLGDGRHDCGLMVFIRRIHSCTSDAAFPSEPVTIHDLTGRRIATVTPDERRRRNSLRDRWIGLSCAITAGTYRLRIGRARRDLAITVPVQRTAQVFLIDHGAISLRTARVYLPHRGTAFDPDGEIARASESALWALSQPHSELPEIARGYIDRIDRDPSFGIACAHVTWRQRDRAAFDRIMHVLIEHASDLPDVAILQHAWPGRIAPPLVLSSPPLFRASYDLALEAGLPVAEKSALLEAASAGYGDSLLCTWSPRWWDTRWIEPTVEWLRSHRAPMITIDAVAETLRLPREIVQRTVGRLDPDALHTVTARAAHVLPAIPSYAIARQIGRGDRSIVYRARRDQDGVEVAVKVIPATRRTLSQGDAAMWTRAVESLAYPGLAAFAGCGVLADGSALFVELALYRESLLDRVAASGRPIGYDEACDLALRALETLARLHRGGTAHGNLDPGSVLIQNEGGVVLGFPELGGGWGPGEPFNTVDPDADRMRFVAPERIRDGQAATPASDVWSMAATLYFVITLELPRERYLGQSERDAVDDSTVVPITQRVGELPDQLAECLGRALAARPEDRFADAAAFHDELRSAAVAARAFRLYDEFVAGSEEFAATMRNVFLRLTGLASGTSTPGIARGDLVYDDPGENERVGNVLLRFQAAGLIATELGDLGGRGPREYIKVSYPELLRGWAQVRRWNAELDATPGTRSVIAALGHAARSWQDGGRPRSLLWSDRLLAQATEIRRRRWFAYNQVEAAFIRCSERHQRRLQIFRTVCFGMLAVASGCLFQQHELASTSRDARDEAQQDLARSRQETGARYVVAGRPLQALPYLVSAGTAASPGSALRMLFHEANQRLPTVLALDHEEKITRATPSRDGSLVVTAGVDGSVVVWEAATGRQVAAMHDDVVAGMPRRGVTPHAHAAQVLDASFSPDGRWLATASQDRTAAVWDVTTGRRKTGPLQHDGIVLVAVFSPDGRYLLTASLDHAARIWNVETGRLVHRLAHRAAVWTAEFSADGTRVVTACSDGIAAIWRTESGTLEHELTHPRRVWSAVFSADGTRVLTASQDGSVRIWDANTGEPTMRKDSRTGIERALLLEDQSDLRSASFDPSGRRIVVRSESAVRVWRIADDIPGVPRLEYRARIADAGFDRDGLRLVIAGGDGLARIWNTDTGEEMLPYLEHAQAVDRAAFSMDGRRVVTVSADGAARVWDASIGAASVRYTFAASAEHVVFSANGKLAVAWRAASAELIDLAARAQTHVLRLESDIAIASFSSDGTRLVTVNGLIARIWDAERGALVATIILPGRPSVATFSADGRRLICTSGEVKRLEDALRMWNAETGAPMALSLDAAGYAVGAWLNVGRMRLVTLGDDGIATVWNMTTRRTIARLRHRAAIEFVVFSADGQHIVTSAADHTVRVWNAATGAQEGSALEHKDIVHAASFSPDGTRIVTISGSPGAQKVQVWDAATALPLTPAWRTTDALPNAGFSPDGARVFAATSQAILDWDVSLDPRSPAEWGNVARRGGYAVEPGAAATRAPGSLK